MQIEIPDDSTILYVKVIPRAKMTELVGYMDDGSLKVRLKAIPEDGKANDELLKFLEKIGLGNWKIRSGVTSTRKILERE